MDSKDQIDKFLIELKERDFVKYEVLTHLRSIVFDVLPSTTETFKYGGIIFSLDENYGGLFVSKNHVSFEFTYGYKLSSALKLEGSGKYRRHLKLKMLGDISKEEIKALLMQIEACSKS